MNWLKQNPFITGLAVVTLLGAGVLIFFLSQAVGQYSDASANYLEAVKKLHTLQNRSPFPSDENLKQTKELAAQYQSSLNTLRSELAAMQTPLNLEIKSQQFQDDLRSAVNQVTERANAAGVALPKDFYLGFGQYANSLPPEKASPYLARQLVIIKQIVNQLIDVKIKSIDRLERRLLVQENAPTGQAARAGSRESSNVLDRNPFDLGFTAEQGKFRVAFNALLNSDQFLLVRAVNVENSNPLPPVVQSAADKNNTASAGGAGSGAPEAPAPGAAAGMPANLDVILGRELVKADLRIEILDFAKPEEAKK